MFSNTAATNIIPNLYAITYDANGNKQRIPLTKQSFVEFCRHSSEEQFEYCDQDLPTNDELNAEVAHLNLQLPPLGLVKNQRGVAVIALERLQQQAIVPYFHELTSMVKIAYHIPSYYSQYDVDEELVLRRMRDNTHHRSIASLLNDGFPNTTMIAKHFPSGKVVNILVAENLEPDEELVWHYGLSSEIKQHNNYTISEKNRQKITDFLGTQTDLYKTINLAITDAVSTTNSKALMYVLDEALDASNHNKTTSAWRECFDTMKMRYILETPAALVYAVMQQLLSPEHLQFILNKLDNIFTHEDMGTLYHFSLIAPRLIQLENWLQRPETDQQLAANYRETISHWAINGELERCLLLFAEHSSDVKYSEARVLPTAQYIYTQLYYNDWKSALQAVASLNDDAIIQSNQCRFYFSVLFNYEKTMGQFRGSTEIYGADFVTYTKLRDIFHEIFQQENQRLLLFCPELKRMCHTILPEVAKSSVFTANMFPDTTAEISKRDFQSTAFSLINLANRSDTEKLLEPNQTSILAAGHFSVQSTNASGTASAEAENTSTTGSTLLQAKSTKLP